VAETLLYLDEPRMKPSWRNRGSCGGRQQLHLQAAQRLKFQDGTPFNARGQVELDRVSIPFQSWRAQAQLTGYQGTDVVDEFTGTSALPSRSCRS